MKITAKKPEMIIVSLDMRATEEDIYDLIKTIEESDSVFRYTCGYRGRVVDMRDAIDLVTNKTGD